MSQPPNPTGPKRSYLENLLFGQLEKYRKQLTDSKAEVARLKAALRCPDETYDHVHRCVRCDSEVT